MSDQWQTSFNSLCINNHLSTGPFRSYHSSDESDAGSPGGGGFRTGYGPGRDHFLAGHRQTTPSFSGAGGYLVDDTPFIPPREAPQQYVSPASLTASDNTHLQVGILARGRVHKENKLTNVSSIYRKTGANNTITGPMSRTSGGPPRRRTTPQSPPPTMDPQCRPQCLRAPSSSRRRDSPTPGTIYATN
jgi:hypothetical protein